MRTTPGAQPCRSPRDAVCPAPSTLKVATLNVVGGAGGAEPLGGGCCGGLATDGRGRGSGPAARWARTARRRASRAVIVCGPGSPGSTPEPCPEPRDRRGPVDVGVPGARCLSVDVAAPPSDPDRPSWEPLRPDDVGDAASVVDPPDAADSVALGVAAMTASVDSCDPAGWGRTRITSPRPSA